VELSRQATIDRLISLTKMMQNTVRPPVVGHPRDKLNVVTMIEIMADSGEFYASVLERYDGPEAPPIAY
jgi:hypothetical protein